MRKIILILLIFELILISCNTKPKKTADEYYNEATTLVYIKRDFSSAIILLNKALTFYPDNTNLNILLASSYVEDAQFEKAMITYNNIIQRFPDLGLAYFNRGVLKAKLNDYYGAIADYQKSKAINFNLEIDINVSYCLLNLRDYYGVINQLSKKFVKKDEDYYLLSLAKYNLGKYNEAANDCMNALKLNPISGQGKYNLLMGNIFWQLKEYEGACLAWSKAGELGESEAYELIRAYCN